jgi:hypothetical protein
MIKKQNPCNPRPLKRLFKSIFAYSAEKEATDYTVDKSKIRVIRGLLKVSSNLIFAFFAEKGHKLHG